MTDKSSEKSKRRGPDDAAKDQQEADWGFESEEGGLQLEKKLGLILVVCLLVGFSFVFYQKYRILNEQTAQADSETAKQDTSDETGSQEPPPAPDASGTQEVESPYFERPAESDSTTSSSDEWILASKETTEPPPAEFVPAPQPVDSTSDSFDPFAVQEGSAPPADDSAAIRWDDETTAEPTAGEPEIVVEQNVVVEPDGDSFGQQASVPTEEPSPFPDPAPIAADAPLQSSEPDFFDDSTNADNGSAWESEPVPPAAEPASPPATFVFESPPQATEAPSAVAEDDAALSRDFEPPPAASAEATDSFDPFFSSDEPSTDQTAEVEPTEPSPFLAPPAAPDPASQEPDADATSGVPTWPFAETEQQSAPAAQWAAPEQVAEPTTVERQPTFVTEPVESSPLPLDAGTELPQLPMQSAPTVSFDGGEPAQSTVGFRPSAQAVVGERETLVTQSDSFWSISEREYGTSRYYMALARYNRDRVSQPEKLRSGMMIRIPPPEVLEARFPELFAPQRSPKPTITPTSGTATAQRQVGLFYDERQQPRYQVGERDTLSTIAQRRLGRASRWPEIYELNRDQLTSPSTLKIGMVLKLPPARSAAIVWPESDSGR